MWKNKSYKENVQPFQVLNRTLHQSLRYYVRQEKILSATQQPNRKLFSDQLDSLSHGKKANVIFAICWRARFKVVVMEAKTQDAVGLNEKQEMFECE